MAVPTPAQTLLIIEDEAALVEVMKSKLVEGGYGVLSCPTASMAMKLLANQKFACVLVDINLEQGTGDQVITWARSSRNSLNSKTPVLVVSSHLSRDLLTRIGKEISGAITKPFERNQLLEKVNAICRK